jgi:hypothetical protein
LNFAAHFSINYDFNHHTSQSGELASNQNQRIKNYDTQLDKNLFTISSKTNCFHFLMFWIEYWYSGLIFALLYWNDERYDWNLKRCASGFSRVNRNASFSDCALFLKPI